MLDYSGKTREAYPPAPLKVMEKIYLAEKQETIEDLYYNMVIKQRPTYTNKELTILQTTPNRRRSRIDFRKAVRTYFPDIKSKEITQFMDKAISTDLLYKDFCYTIRRQIMAPRRCTITKEEFKKALHAKNLS